MPEQVLSNEVRGGLEDGRTSQICAANCYKPMNRRTGRAQGKGENSLAGDWLVSNRHGEHLRILSCRSHFAWTPKYIFLRYSTGLSLFCKEMVALSALGLAEIHPKGRRAR